MARRRGGVSLIAWSAHLKLLLLALVALSCIWAALAVHGVRWRLLVPIVQVTALHALDDAVKTPLGLKASALPVKCAVRQVRRCCIGCSLWTKESTKKGEETHIMVDPF